MRSRLIPILVIAGAMALGGAPAQARRDGPPPDERLEAHLAEIDLTPAQRDEVGAILDAGREERQALRERKRETIKQMHALLEQDPPDEAAVMLQAERIGAIKIEAHKVMLRTLLQIRGQLSPEQRRQLMTMKRRDCPATQEPDEN